MHQPRLNQKAFWVQEGEPSGPTQRLGEHLPLPGPLKITHPPLFKAQPLLLATAMCKGDTDPCLLGTEMDTPLTVQEAVGARGSHSHPRHTCHHPTYCCPAHQRVQDVVAGDGLHIIHSLSYGLATCHISRQLWTVGTGHFSISPKLCSLSSPALHPTKESSTHPTLGPGNVGLKEVQQLL